MKTETVQGSDNSNNRKLLSIVMPVYNEEYNIQLAYDSICEVLNDQPYEFEFVFTDNNSEDATFEKILNIAETDKRVRAVRFNRNYGFQRSLMTGYRLAIGDAAIQIDCDLQDPPELILTFIELWQKGHDVVVGIRNRREENYFLTKCRSLYYSFINYVSDDEITKDAGDFRLIDRKVLNKVININDNNPYVRGLTSAFATNETGIHYDRKKRQYGESKFPFHSLVNLASDGIFSMTLFPLRLAGHISLVISLITIALSLYYLIAALFFGNDWPDGFATLVLLLLFSISLNATLLAILRKYLGQIFLQQQNRPIVVFERVINVDELTDQIEKQ
jgi:polyisoprenyl-phosphate glycosyltransferase